MEERAQLEDATQWKGCCAAEDAEEAVEVSVIVPMRNAAEFIEECVRSIVAQRGCVPLAKIQLCVHDDCSTDASLQTLHRALQSCAAEQNLANVVVSQTCKCLDGCTCGTRPIGCGAARNKAVSRSSGRVLVFCDADDVMLPDRVATIAPVAALHPNALVGSNFTRIPAGSTARYEAFHRSLHAHNMLCFAFRDMPVAMPTLACHRTVLSRVGGFVEKRSDDSPEEPVAEDLELLYNHLAQGGALIKVPQTLVLYRHHAEATSLALSRRYLLSVRVAAFERLVIVHWVTFSIWGAGRDGRQFYKALTNRSQSKVQAFLDIDTKKIARGLLHGKPVRHFLTARPPIVACVALDRTNGDFERNVKLIGSLIPGINLFFLV
mmetsp:Transcript_13972/g.37505  ORF Transcript_13972/g.37505 Transcript_13972/m.37505 type:complete len:378 (+) Transcript_13972:817-1950(+)